MNSQINTINSVIEAFFTENPSIKIIPAKDLMPALIKAGVFMKDNKNGKPIRDILRALDKNNQLGLIPYIHADRKEKDIYWYFIPENAEKPSTSYKQEEVSSKKIEAKKVRQLSDESYVIDLCDNLLNRTAQRQYRFDFLVGDLHKDGKTTTELPVDAYYEDLNLVIEYKESQQNSAQHFSSNQFVKTVSGVNRYEQRKIYDERKRIVLPKNGKQLIEISYSIFDCDEENKIIRNMNQDLRRIIELLENNDIEI
ncbi:MAG TPA: hypothetical protein VLZ75_05790 [Chitinophagales bacterium]|nr:hypothetical protein [Chitinophagales bacterium]